MKRTVITLIILASFVLTYAVDFTLKSGRTIQGSLQGIRDNSAYVVDANDKLHILHFSDILAVNAGSGDISDQIKSRKPYMNINPAEYHDGNIFSTMVSSDSLSAFVAAQEQLDVKAQTKQLKRIADNFTYLSVISTIGIVSTLIFLLTFDPEESDPANQ
jgi:hypothetical protein